MRDTDRYSYIAAARTPQLINRHRELAALEAAAAGSGSPVFYLTGSGGNGKTHLSREFLTRARQSDRAERDLWVARELVDFYHTHNHTAEGLCWSILLALGPTPGFFDEFKARKQRLDQYLQDLSTGQDVTQQKKATIQAFTDDFRRLAGDYRVVLAFDTAELLLYEADPIQELLQIGQPGIEARDWFLNEFLPAVSNAVVLIAGRPEPPQLREDLKAALGDRLVELELGPLEEEDSLAYFDAVAEGAREQGAVEIADQVDEIPEDVRRVIHRYTGGRPILLALVLDYLMVTDRLLPALRRPLSDVDQMRPEQLRAIQRDLEGEIVRSIQETGRRADDTVRHLAWARRGLDAAMLAWLAGLSQAEAQERLDEVQGLSFVKERPDDHRIFLQDEMYDLLQRHVLDTAAQERVWTVNSRLVDYYEREIRAARLELKALREERAPLAEKLGQAQVWLQNGIAEKIHYELRRDPVLGFEAYYRAAEEAFQSRHEGMDLQLREELLTYFHKHAPAAVRRQFEDAVDWDAGVRWVKRYIVRERYGEAIDLAKELRVQQAERMARLGALAEAELSIWEANARAYAGRNLPLAQERFESSVAMLKAFRGGSRFDAWRASFLLAHAYNNWGYLLRSRGAFDAAAARYRLALPLWRALKKGADADHANTLNNLAFALGEIGDFDQALRYCRDGLEMREELGPRYPVALSLNTMAMIQIRHDQPHRAEKVAERALATFERLGSQRGMGMAYRALAEALRRQAEVQGLYPPRDQLARLKAAEEYADKAVDLFAVKVKEQGRLVESLIERGCVFRNWARIRIRYPDAEEGTATDLARHASRALRRATEEAGEAFPHLKMDALVNLAWHQYYMGEPDEARATVENEVFPLAKEYQIEVGKGAPQLETPVSFFWVQLGKASSLLGQIEMAEFRRRQQEPERDWYGQATDHLSRAARRYTLAIAYDQLFGTDFREMRSGLDLIYDELKRLNARELGEVYQAVRQTQDEYCLEAPCRMLAFLERSFGSPESLDEVASGLERAILPD